MATKKPGVNSALKAAVNKLLADAETMDKDKFERRCKAIDRALKLAQIEAKINLDDGFGEGFSGE